MYKYYDEKGQHLHTFEDKPLIGTTTALKILAKPLTWWAAGMAVGRLGWTNNKVKVKGKYQNVPLETRLEAVRGQYEAIKGLTIEQYLAVLDEAYRAHDEYKEERAEVGTDRHTLLEHYVKDCVAFNGGTPLAVDPEAPTKIDDFIGWASKNISKFLWSESHVYSTELWTGGIADVGWIDKDNRVIAGDFKSSKEAYFDQFVQIGGYDVMLSENGGHDENGVKNLELPSPIQGYCVVPFGAENFEPKIEYDTESYRNAFKWAVGLYKLSQIFNQ